MRLVHRISTMVISTLAGAVLAAAPASASHPPGGGGIDTAGIAHLARSNVGKGACSETTRHTVGFESSCHGFGGRPEYWCADFAKWAWSYYDVPLDGLTAAAHSFYDWARSHGGFTKTPGVGDVAIFSYDGSTAEIHHVAVVVARRGPNVMLMSGDWGGESGQGEAHFAATSHVVNNGWVNATPGTRKTHVDDMYLVGYAAP